MLCSKAVVEFKLDSLLDKKMKLIKQGVEDVESINKEIMNLKHILKSLV